MLMEMRSHELIVVIPALNEEANIGAVVRQVRATVGSEVVVIDDASTDGTAGVAREAGANVLRLSLRSGAWGAMRTGICYAFKHGYRVAVTMDADGQHMAESIQSIVAPIESNRADVVIGSCVYRGSLARKFTWAFFRKLTRLGVEDLTSGLRAYNRAAISALASAGTALFDYQDIGVLLYMRGQGLNISEVPVDMRPRISGSSRIFSSWCDVLEYLLVTGVLCLTRRK